MLPDPKLQFIVDVDASDVGIRAVTVNYTPVPSSPRSEGRSRGVEALAGRGGATFPGLDRSL